MSEIAWTGESVALAAANSNGLYYWWLSDSWNRETVAPDSYGGASISWTGDSVGVAAVDNNQNIFYWWQRANTAPWNFEQVASAG